MKTITMITLMAGLILPQTGTSDTLSTQTGLRTTTFPDTGGLRPDSVSAISVMSPASSSADLPADSLRTKQLRDSLMQIKDGLRRLYLDYPQNADSIADGSALHPFQIYSADASGFSQLQQSNPGYLTIPFAVTTQLSRMLFYGFPAPLTVLIPDRDMAGTPFNALRGSDLFSASEIRNASFSLPGQINITCQPARLVNPETILYFENGLFDEQALNMRFARPISRDFQIGIFSDYHEFARRGFNHSTGGMYGMYLPMYQGAGLDTTWVSHRGANPLVREHTIAARLAWYHPRGAAVTISYKYLDLHNDIACEFHDSLHNRDTLAWDEIGQYSHRTDLSIDDAHSGPFRFNGSIYLLNDVVRASTVVGNPTLLDRKGENFQTGMGLSPYLPLGSDTIAIVWQISRAKKIIFNGDRRTLIHNRILASYVHPFAIAAFKGSARAALGYDLLTVNTMLEDSLIWHFSVDAMLKNHLLSLFARQDFMSADIPYDTTLSARPGLIADRYRTFGGEYRLLFTKASLMAGYCRMIGVSDTTVRNAWPAGMPPYRQPDWVVTVSPALGRFHGFAFMTSLMYANTKPYFKLKGLLSYQSPLRPNRQRIFLDLSADYWSHRDIESFAGIDTWGRQILNVSLKTTVQIQSFRLFWKIDNMLNRSMAYVPGYYLPGLTFRWGFNWFLPE
jgi:hypothetical protein